MLHLSAQGHLMLQDYVYFSDLSCWVKGLVQRMGQVYIIMYTDRSAETSIVLNAGVSHYKVDILIEAMFDGWMDGWMREFNATFT